MLLQPPLRDLRHTEKRRNPQVAWEGVEFFWYLHYKSTMRETAHLRNSILHMHDDEEVEKTDPEEDSEADDFAEEDEDAL